MRGNKFGLIDIKQEHLDVLLTNITITEKAFNNADFLNPTDTQRVIIATVKYYKRVMPNTQLDEFNKDLLYSCSIKEIKQLDTIIASEKLKKNLNVIIKKIWDENSVFKSLPEQYKKLVTYFEYLKYMGTDKTELLEFTKNLDLASDFDEGNNKIKDTSDGVHKEMDDVFSMLGKMFGDK